MEFRKCPHCAASIIDDEAVDCPSCGKPLAATPAPAKKPAAAAAAPKKKAAAAAAPEKPKKKAPSRIGETTDPDDPFDLGGDATGGKTAIPVAPKPGKNRMVRVVCPMCESPGFIPEKAQGKDVRCWKKTCRLPVFQAPMPEREPEPEPEKKGLPAFVRLGIPVLLGLAAIGGGAWYAVQPKELPTIDPIVAPTPDPNTPGVDEDPGPGLFREPETTDEGPTFLPLADIRAEAVEKIGAASRDRNVQDGNSAARRAAEVAVVAGDFASINDRLKQISGADFYRIKPLTMLAHVALQGGDTGTATRAADDALKFSQRMPRRGRQPLDWATALAEVLVRLGRDDEAANLLDTHSSPDLRGELSALWTGAADLGTYNVAATRRSSLVRDTDNPQWLAVTRALVARGEVDRALAWAQRADRPVRDDALTLWAGTLARLQGKDAAREAVVNVPDLPPAVQARMLAAAGLARLEKTEEDVQETAVAVEAAESVVETDAADDAPAPTPPAAPNAASGDDEATTAGDLDSVEAIAREGDQLKAETERAQAAAETEADSLLDQALSLRAQSTVPADEFAVPDLVALHDSARQPNAGLPDADAIRNAALANLKIAELQHARGDDEAAWQSIEAGLQTLRAMAPAPAKMRDLVTEYRSRKDQLTQQLQSRLKIRSRTEADRAFTRYRQQVDVYAEAAEERLRLQGRLLAAALDWGLEARVGQYLESTRDTEPWKTTPIALRLGAPADAGPDGVPTLPAQLRVGPKVDEFIEPGDGRGLWRYLRGNVRDPIERDLWAAEAAARWIETGNRRAFLEFVGAVNGDESLKEDLLERGAAQAVTAGTGPQLWNDLQDDTIARWDPNHWVAIYRGYATPQ